MEAVLMCLAIMMVSTPEDSTSKYWLDKNSVTRACEYSSALVESASKHKVDPFVIAAIVWNESRWTPSAFDGSCCGIGQINPSFVPENCTQLKDPAISLNRIGAILDGWRQSLPASTDEYTHLISCYAAGSACTKSTKAVKHSKFILSLSEKYRRSYETIKSVSQYLTIGPK